MENNEEQPISVTPERYRKLLQFENRTRPNGWSNKSMSSYYKEEIGQEMKGVFDGIINDGQPRYYYFQEAATKGLMPATLYTRINQSIRYLTERLDPTGIYSKLWKTGGIMVTKVKGVGYAIHKGGSIISDGIQPHVPTGEPQAMSISAPTAKWRTELDEFVKNSQPGDEFCRDRLYLERQQILSLDSEFQGLDKFIGSFTSSKIYVVHLKEGEL